MPVSEVEQKLGSLQAWVTAAIVGAVVFALTVMGFMVWQSYRVGENAQQLRAVAAETHESLCALKLDIKTRYDSGVKYLKDHPRGLTAHGEVAIPAAQIQQSLDNQNATLKALEGLDCPGATGDVAS